MTTSSRPITYTDNPDSFREIREVFAHYVRAADNRDAPAMAAVFAPDAVLTIFYRGSGENEILARLEGASGIGAAVATGMAPHPPLGWSHHTILDPIMTLDDGKATVDAQFIVYNVVGLARPEKGWPAGASGAQGRITPIESGYINASLRYQDKWTIDDMSIFHDLPFVFEGR